MQGEQKETTVRGYMDANIASVWFSRSGNCNEWIIWEHDSLLIVLLVLEWMRTIRAAAKQVMLFAAQYCATSGKYFLKVSRRWLVTTSITIFLCIYDAWNIRNITHVEKGVQRGFGVRSRWRTRHFRLTSFPKHVVFQVNDQIDYFTFAEGRSLPLQDKPCLGSILWTFAPCETGGLVRNWRGYLHCNPKFVFHPLRTRGVDYPFLRVQIKMLGMHLGHPYPVIRATYTPLLGLFTTWERKWILSH